MRPGKQSHGIPIAYTASMPPTMHAAPTFKVPFPSPLIREITMAPIKKPIINPPVGPVKYAIPFLKYRKACGAQGNVGCHA